MNERTEGSRENQAVPKACTAEPRAPSRRRHSKGWPPARRLAQSRRCRAQAPWRHATGPRTAPGKARACLNARRHGLYGAEGRAWREWLAAQNRFLKQIRAILNIKPDSFTVRKKRLPFSAPVLKPSSPRRRGSGKAAPISHSVPCRIPACAGMTNTEESIRKPFPSASLPYICMASS